MKWNSPRIGDVRYRRKFCLLPISDNGQTVWLEYANVVEVFGGGDMYSGTGPTWQFVRLMMPHESVSE